VLHSAAVCCSVLALSILQVVNTAAKTTSLRVAVCCSVPTYGGVMHRLTLC